MGKKNRPTSPYRMNEQVKKGQAPRDISRVDPADPKNGVDEPHIHFKGHRAALTYSGEWQDVENINTGANECTEGTDGRERMEPLEMMEVFIEEQRQYPKIALTDSVVHDIQIEKNTVTFMFDHMGFWVSNKKEEAFHRVSNASLCLLDCDVENIDILLVEAIEGKFVETPLKFQSFARKIHNKQWSFTVIWEYLTDGGGLIYGCIQERRKYNRCYLRIAYDRYGFRYSEG